METIIVNGQKVITAPVNPEKLGVLVDYQMLRNIFMHLPSKSLVNMKDDLILQIQDATSTAEVIEIIEGEYLFQMTAKLALATDPPNKGDK